MTGAPFTFDAVAQQVAERQWRPFPGLQTSKVPAMRGWNGLNKAGWDRADLAATIAEYQPPESYCACLAVPNENVALDIDIMDPSQAAFADKLADDVLGKTPLKRIGLAPKNVRIYRNAGGILSRKLHPLEIFSGSGQFVGFGWHQEADRPYLWPDASPLDLDAYSTEIPLLTLTQLDRFTSELFKVVRRRQSPTRQGRPYRVGTPMTIGDRLRMLTMLHGSWRYAAATVLSEAVEGNRNETGWTVVASAAGRGVAEDVIWRLFERHFTGWGGFSESDLASAIERTRPKQRASSMSFIFPTRAGGRNVAR